MRNGRGGRRWAWHGLFAVAVGALLLTRAAGLISLEGALGRGEASGAWHPDFNRLGRFAAAHAGEAAFIAADWGVGTQIFCLAQGRRDLVRELFWEYRGPEDLARFQREAGVASYYAVSLRPPSGVAPENTARIFRDLAGHPMWHEVEVEPELRDLSVIAVRKFHFVPAVTLPVSLRGRDQALGAA